MRTDLEEVGPTASYLYGGSTTLKGVEVEGEELVISKTACSFL